MASPAAAGSTMKNDDSTIKQRALSAAHPHQAYASADDPDTREARLNDLLLALCSGRGVREQMSNSC